MLIVYEDGGTGMKIDHRTRGNSDSRGKSRLFFAAHSDDYVLYLDRVVEMLHKHQNCAIYFFFFF